MNRQYFAWIAGLLAVAIYAAALFGFAGFRTILGFAALFILPVFFVVWKTDLDVEEKIFFSLFIGLGLFGLLIFMINSLLPSFRASVIASLLVAAAAGIIWPKIVKKAKKELAT